jgi:hypothetical protein
MHYSGLNGVMTAVEAADITRVQKATMAAMTTLGLRPMRRSGDAFSVVIAGSIVVGAIPQDREVRVRLARLSASTTELTVRILFTRDEQKLVQILEAIRLELTKGSPPR